MNSLPEIKERLLSLAREIQAFVPGLYLAGGTAIMIKHEHRISTDLDLFTEKGGLAGIESRVRRRFGPEIERIVHFPGGDNVDLFVRGIKASFVRFPFPNVEPVETMGGVKLASDRDLVLNKIYVAGPRAEAKDPADIACLLDRHRDWSREMIRSDFRSKFKDEKFEIYLAAVMAFDDYHGLDQAARSVLERWNAED